MLALGQVDGIGEVEAMLVPLESERHSIRLCQSDARQPEQLSERGRNLRFAERIDGLQYPGRLEQNGIGDEDFGLSKAALGPLELLGVVTSQQTNDDVSVDWINATAPEQGA